MTWEWFSGSAATPEGVILLGRFRRVNAGGDVRPAILVRRKWAVGALIQDVKETQRPPRAPRITKKFSIRRLISKSEDAGLQFFVVLCSSW
jgi:hypothetical protein